MMKKIQIPSLLNFILNLLNFKRICKFIKKYKTLLIVFFVAVVFLFFEGLKHFDFDVLMGYKNSLLQSAEKDSYNVSVRFFLLYLLISMLGIPGSTLFSVVGGFLFGFVEGIVFSLFAITLGSCLTFLISRFFLDKFFMKKPGRKLKKIQKLLKKDAIYYLFALRLFPFTPLFFTNIVMGLSSIKMNVFFIVSFLALIPPIFIYVNMGTQISNLEDINSLMTVHFISSFLLIGLFPLIVKNIFRFVKWKKSRKELALDSDYSCQIRN